MAASYPTSVKDFGSDVVNSTSVIEASHINDIRDEVEAIETELGSDPSGSESTVKDRIAALESADLQFDVKASCRVATIGNGDLATDFATGESIDEVTLSTGDRILIKNQTLGATNGIYTVNASGEPTRATDFDSDADVTAGAYMWVTEGDVNDNTAWVLGTNDPINLGTTLLVFNQWSGDYPYNWTAAGDGGSRIVSDGEVFTFAGGAGIGSTVSGLEVTHAIDSTVTTLTGSQTLTNKTLTSPVLNTGTVGTSLTLLEDATMIFEGATDNAYETTLTVTDPTADRTVTIPNATDTLVGKATTDTLTNKTLTSPVFNTGVSGSAVKDEDNMSSDSATHVSTQQSIKAYVDTEIAAAVTAEDLDVTSDSGTIAIDLDSETLSVVGGEGVDTSATGNVVTVTGEDATSANKGIASFDSDDFTASSGAISLSSFAGDRVYSGDSIQTIHDALPSSGGVIQLDAETTYTVTARLNISKDNVTIRGAGIGSSILQIDDSLVDHMLWATGENFRISGVTFNGNGSTNTSNNKSTLLLGDTGAVVDGIEVKNFRTIGISATGASPSTPSNATIINSRIIGMASASINSMGIHFNEDDPRINGIIISNNVIKDNGINAIFGGGSNITIDGNYFANNHLQISPEGGGQIDIVTGDGVSSTKDMDTTGVVIANNVFDAGGGALTSGLELNGNDITVVGNTIRGQDYYGVILQRGNRHVISSNIISNSGTTGTNSPGIRVNADVEDFQITGNKIFDDQDTKTQSWGIQIMSGDSDNYIISSNDVRGNVNAAGLSDSGTGTTKQIFGNLPISLPTWVKDEDNFASNSDAFLATQQSIKAYVDAQIATEDTIAELNDTDVSAEASGNILIYDGDTWDNDAVSGDATLATGGAITIAADAVTYAKMQDVTTTNRLLGRDSAGAGVIEEITPANTRTMLNVADGADVTDATSVTAAGALMDSEVDADIKTLVLP
ncbi:MAG: right-handed parallel beta-helix repeat-containing protein, partial [Dehalococcoidales bacterium]|nr:right-handed parallel beta-helix repeat-containing protein [Dehalococcoidales bacterium]